jgi:hypothetical protein
MAGTTVGGNPTWGEACRPNRKEDCGNNKMKKQKLFLRKRQVYWRTAMHSAQGDASSISSRENH